MKICNSFIEISIHIFKGLPKAKDFKILSTRKLIFVLDTRFLRLKYGWP
jgi:hypothetical protein